MGLLHMHMREAGTLRTDHLRLHTLYSVLASFSFKEKLRKNRSSLKGERIVRICRLCFEL